MSTIDETLEIMKRLPGGDYVRRAAVLKSVKKDVGGPIDVDALVKMTKIHERRKSIMMERSGSLTHIPTANMGKENNRVSSIDSDKANTEISEEFGESIEIDTAEGIFEAK